MTATSPKSTLDQIHARLDQIATCCERIRFNLPKNPEAAQQWAAELKVEANAVWLVVPTVRAN